MWRFLTWLGTIAGVIGFAAFFAGVADTRFAGSGEIERVQCYMRETIQDWTATPVSYQERPLVVLFAQLDGGDQPQDTIALFEAVNRGGLSGVSLRRLCRVLAITPGQDHVAARTEAEIIGRTWLQARGGDVLVWGAVSRDGRLSLNFLSGGASQSAEAQFSGGTQGLSLRREDLGAFSDALLASILAGARPVAEAQGQAVAAQLIPLMPKLRSLYEQRQTMPAESAESIVSIYRSALFRLSEQSPDPQWRAELVRVSGGDDPASLEYRAWALQAEGERSGQDRPLEEAIGLYRRLLVLLPRAKDPLRWARIQNGLGIALRSLGERESGVARLEEAVQAYREALKERTRERVPLQWAMTQNNLGGALLRLGERESGTAQSLKFLEEAVAAYREALKERTRERVPLHWAATQNNLGIALSRLGERESGTERLEEAVAAFSEALKEYTRERVPLQWAGTQNNLGLALLSLGERESGTARLEEAVRAYREALKEYTRDRVPLDWAYGQHGLSGALLLIGQRRQDRAVLEQALLAIDGALEEYRKGNVGYWIPRAEARRAEILQALGR